MWERIEEKGCVKGRMAEMGRQSWIWEFSYVQREIKCHTLFWQLRIQRKSQSHWICYNVLLQYSTVCTLINYTSKRQKTELLKRRLSHKPLNVNKSGDKKGKQDKERRKLYTDLEGKGICINYTTVLHIRSCLWVIMNSVREGGFLKLMQKLNCDRKRRCF